MTARKSLEAILDTRRDSREDRDYKNFLRSAKREEEAEEQVGTLIRDGVTVRYVYPAGGKYREGNCVELVQYLIRNRYA